MLHDTLALQVTHIYDIRGWPGLDTSFIPASTAHERWALAGAHRICARWVWADDDLNLLMVEGRGPFSACHRRRWALAVWAATCVMWYSACVHFIISAGFISKSGMWILGKDPNTGQVPSWSYVLWAAFFIPTYLYTALHAGYADKKHGVPVASEVDDAFWIGGRYAAQPKKKWALTIDLTVEFDEGCMDTSDEYLLLRCWDGVPPTRRPRTRVPPRRVESHGAAERVAWPAVDRRQGGGRGAGARVSLQVREVLGDERLHEEAGRAEDEALRRVMEGVVCVDSVRRRNAERAGETDEHSSARQRPSQSPIRFRW